jgi:hypothetical protein
MIFDHVNFIKFINVSLFYAHKIMYVGFFILVIVIDVFLVRMLMQIGM